MRTYVKFLMIGLAAVFASCAVITVNIYFPEKDVKEAYKELEKELMAPAREQEKKPEGQPETKPQSSIRFDFVSAAYAQEGKLSENIRDIMRKMPDVAAAYKEIGSLIPEVDKLRDRGAVGEANNGLLAEREGSLNPAEKQLVEKMNASRKVVIQGMAKAIVRINRLPENEQNINQVLPQATTQFASIRQDSAKKGWWVQDANGIWAKK